MPAATGRTSDAIYRAWITLRTQDPQLDAFESAARLGVSEGRLTAARCRHGDGSPLAPEPAPLLAGIATLGPVTAITRNSAATLVNIGTYGQPDIGKHSGIVIGENIDLRIFPSGWVSAYAISERSASGRRCSLQIFDALGAATHEVVLGPDGNFTAYDDLVAAFSVADAELRESMSAPPSDTAGHTDVDVTVYRRAYAAMQDTHDFFMLLQAFGLAREEGLRLAGPAFARAVAADAHRRLLNAAAEANIPLMIFVANSGMVQIASGTIPRPTLSGGWCSLADPRFALRLYEAGIARAWAVGKPTVNGIVTSLELYAQDGSLISQIFGERHAGEVERADWAAAMSELPVSA